MMANAASAASALLVSADQRNRWPVERELGHACNSQRGEARHENDQCCGRRQRGVYTSIALADMPGAGAQVLTRCCKITGACSGQAIDVA